MPVEVPAPAAAPAPSFWRDLNATHAVSGFIGFLFATSGPLAIILATGTRGGLSEAEIASWVFGSLFLNGAMSVGYSLAYRQPLAFFWTIPGTVLVGPALGHLSFAEVVGAFIATGLLMMALGALGLVRRAMAAVPMPIIMGMVAGVFLQFGLDWVRAFRLDAGIAVAMTVAFLLVGAVPKLAGRLPPILAALAAGAAAICVTGSFAAGGLGDLGQGPVLAAPQLLLPRFSWAALAELVVPLAITVLVVQNGQGVAILTRVGHRPPVDSIAVGCGAASVLSAFVGAVSTCLTGPVNAIISSMGERRTQYTAGVMVGLYAMQFGLVAPLLTRLMLSTPPAFIATLAGLAMLRVLQSAFAVAFQSRFALGALVTFLVTVAGIPLFNIGAPFWALIAGTLVSLVLEREDWHGAAVAP
ncbi:MAG: benzoate/H(+) symporter BenE family transporter [Hyphomicrobiaceae bacterium]|nr:benzoate/H(+) symporter BenE family transporter [Hyphomicrobiaceae bacterium]